MNSHITAGTPTQVAHPWRAVLRTVAAFIAGSLTTAVLGWVLATFGLDLSQYENAMVESITLAIVTAFSGFFTWLMARPRVNAFIERVLPWLATGVHTESEVR